MNWSMPAEWDQAEPDVVIEYEPYDDEQLDLISVMFEGLDILPILDEATVSGLLDAAAQHEIDNTQSDEDILADIGDQKCHAKRDGD